MKTLKNYKLSFTSKQAWEEFATEQLQVEGEWISDIQGTPVHVNVPIGFEDGEDEQGNPIQVQIYSDRYHVDMIAALDDNHPVRAYVCPIAVTSEKQAHSYQNNLPMAQPAEAKPDTTWLKADIQEWLTNNNTIWTTSQTKAQLLLLVP